MKKIKTVVIPLAGKGTRFLPATKVVPKEMLALLDRPLLDYAISEAIEAGIRIFIFVLNRDNKLPIKYITKNSELEKFLLSKKKKNILKKITRIVIKNEKIKVVVQENPKGLGDAIYRTRKFVKKEDFAVILPDDLILGKNCLKELLNIYNRKDCGVLAVKEVDKKDISKYGIIKPKIKGAKTTQISSIVEKPLKNPPSNLGVVGRYILKNSIFKYLKETSIGSGGEIQLTDAIHTAAKDEKIFATKFAGERYDCGSKLGFFKAQLACAIRDKEIKNFKEIIKEETSKAKRYLK